MDKAVSKILTARPMFFDDAEYNGTVHIIVGHHHTPGNGK